MTAAQLIVQLFCFMSTNKYTTNNNHTLVAVSDSDGETPVYLYADPSTHELLVQSVGGGGGGGAVTIADGADITQGAIADATVAAGAAGTISAKMRRLTTDISSIDTKIDTLATEVTLMSAAASLNSIASDTSSISTGIPDLLQNNTFLNVVSSDGNPAGGNSLLISGVDGSGDAQTISTNASGHVNTIIASALPAGTNEIGKLAANSGVDIGDVTINNASGAAAVNIQDGGNSITVDGTVALSAGSAVIGAITNLIPGTGNTNFGAAVDAAAGATKVGVLAIGVRDDTLGTLTPVDNDYTEGLRVSSRGALWVTTDGASPAPVGSALNTYSVRITTNTTTTPTSTTSYISSIAISSEVAGTTSTLTIQDKQGTPLKLINGLTTVAITTTPTILNFQTPIKMTSGIDIITAGVAAATLDLWIDYYQ